MMEIEVRDINGQTVECWLYSFSDIRLKVSRLA